MLNKLLFCVFILLLPSFAFAYLAAPLDDDQERITNFESYITINPDASIDVEEIITAYANQNKIKHGITRIFPTIFNDHNGNVHFAHYQIQQILTNNSPERFTTDNFGEQLAIYIGDKHYLLEPGYYIYTIRYHVNEVVDFQKNQDSFNWNITGNNWEVDILTATTTIKLPKNAHFLSAIGYTQSNQNKIQDVAAKENADNTLTFTTTLPLYEGQALIANVSWPKGFVHQPSWKELIKYEIYTNKGDEIAFEIGALLLCYYLLIWFLEGNYFKKNSTPLTEPPANLSPAAMRFILKLQCDAKSIVATLFNLGMKGLIFVNENDLYQISIHQKNSPTQVNEPETLFTNKLFAKSQSVTLDQEHADIFNKAFSTLKKYYYQAYEHKFFTTNTTYIIPGLILTFLSFLAVGITANNAITFTLLIIFAIWSFMCFSILSAIIPPIYNKSYREALVFFLLALPFFAGEALLIFILTEQITLIIVSLLFVTMAINLLFYFLLKVPTKEGRELLEQIERFKLFLTSSSTISKDKFMKYLPYAIALNVENQWSARAKETKIVQPEWFQCAKHPEDKSLEYLKTTLTNKLNSILVD